MTCALSTRLFRLRSALNDAGVLEERVRCIQVPQSGIRCASSVRYLVEGDCWDWHILLDREGEEVLARRTEKWRDVIDRTAASLEQVVGAGRRSRIEAAAAPFSGDEPQRGEKVKRSREAGGPGFGGDMVVVY